MNENNPVTPPPDDIGDEELVLAFYAGCKEALDTLFYRYLKYLRFFLLKESWRKDDSSIDDIVQETFLRVFMFLKDRKFAPRGEGSFKAWFYAIARNVCMNYNRREGHQPVNIPKLFLETAPAKPVEPEIIKKEKQKEDRKKLNSIFVELTPEERQLIFLLGEGKKYKEIQALPEFNKHSIDYLMLKAYNIRKKLSH
jgi:RNA polymerase sigma factor (sigma-70 family)